MNNKEKIILLTFPTGSHSIVRNGLLADIYEKKFNNIDLVDFKYWNINIFERYKLLEKYLDYNMLNYLIVIPGTEIQKYIDIITICILKKKYKIQSSLFLLDGIERISKIQNIEISYITKLFEFFDIVFSYDCYECSKYNFFYLDRPIKKFNIDLSKNKNGVIFCGRNKNRIALLREIAILLENNKINYDFYVLKKPEEKVRDDANIHFVDFIYYKNLVSMYENYSVLLSLVGKYNHFPNINYNEAIIYNKKLLTDCQFLENIPHFNEKYMKKFTNVDDIDLDFLKSDKNVNYKYTGYYSIENFIDTIVTTSRMNEKLHNHSSFININICLHFSKIGWIFNNFNEEVIFYDGRQLECIIIYTTNNDFILNYEVYQDGIGWQNSNTQDFEIVGIHGKSLPITKVKFHIEQSASEYYLIYRCYLENYGWTKYYNDNEMIDATKYGKRIFGLQIIIKKL